MARNIVWAAMPPSALLIDNSACPSIAAETEAETAPETETYFLFARAPRRRGGRDQRSGAKPEAAKQSRARPQREGRPGGKPKTPRSETRPDRPDRPDRPEQKPRPQRPERPVDPDNPFAALLALKTRS